MAVTYEIEKIDNSLYVLVSKVPIKTTILPGGVKWGGGLPLTTWQKALRSTASRSKKDLSRNDV